MNDPLPGAFADVRGMPDLMPLLEAMSADPGWAKRDPSLWPAPRKTFVPCHWSYAAGRAALQAAGRFVSTELAERRNLILFNPVEGNRYATARTIIAAYQMVLPGETARSHRHTPNALRLVMDTGPNAYTVVNGKKLPMLPGDILLTPNWSWHGHANESDRNAVWIDFLDVPMMHFFEGSMFFEHHSGGLEQTGIVDAHSPMRFAATDYVARLDAACPARPGEISVELGPPHLDTLALFVRRLEPGYRLSWPRTTANKVYAVISGRGRSNIDEESPDGRRFEWNRGDVFVVPSWRSHRFESFERSHLLEVTDSRLLDRLHWLRTEGDVADRSS